MMIFEDTLKTHSGEKSYTVRTRLRWAHSGSAGKIMASLIFSIAPPILLIIAHSNRQQQQLTTTKQLFCFFRWNWTHPQSLCSFRVVPLLVAPSGWFCHLPSAAQRKVAPGSGKSLAASRIAGQKGGNNWPQRRQELCPWFLIAISAICDIITSGYIPRVEKGNNK